MTAGVCLITIAEEPSKGNTRDELHPLQYNMESSTASPHILFQFIEWSLQDGNHFAVQQDIFALDAPYPFACRPAHAMALHVLQDPGCSADCAQRVSPVL